MKTIELSDEMYASLMELSKEINSQDHRGTRMPYMIQVSEKKEVSAYEGCGETYWYGIEGEKLEELEDENEVVRDFLYEKHGGGHEKIFDTLYDYEKESILKDLGYNQHEVTEEDELSNFFFTEKGLRESYGKDVNTFLTGVRNAELETVMKFLCELSGGKLHR